MEARVRHRNQRKGYAVSQVHGKRAESDCATAAMTPERVRKDRSLVMRIAYLSLDRADLLECVRHIQDEGSKRRRLDPGAEGRAVPHQTPICVATALMGKQTHGAIIHTNADEGVGAKQIQPIRICAERGIASSVQLPHHQCKQTRDHDYSVTATPNGFRKSFVGIRTTDNSCIVANFSDRACEREVLNLECILTQFDDVTIRCEPVC
eukprot:6272137-Amphidinium_carterae.1